MSTIAPAVFIAHRWNPGLASELQFDWVTYSGDPSTPIAETDPNDWTFLKDTTDLTQMLFGLPMTADQMDALAD